MHLEGLSWMGIADSPASPFDEAHAWAPHYGPMYTLLSGLCADPACQLQPLLESREEERGSPRCLAASAAHTKPSPGLLLLPRSAYTMPRPTPPHCLLGSTMWKRWFTSLVRDLSCATYTFFCTQNPMKFPLMRPSPPTLISGSTMWKRWFTAPPHDDDSAAACALDGTCKLPAAASSSSPSPSPPVTSAAASGQQQHLSSSSVGPKKGTWSGYFFGK